MVRISGSKAAMGAAQQIISMMPSHQKYLEGFGGTGAVMRRKLPAPIENIIIEKDGAAAAQLLMTARPGWRIIHGDVFDYARSLLAMPDLVAYFDPPYVLDTRRSDRRIYRHQFTDQDHEKLAAMLSETTVRASILISGYTGLLYAGLYRHWRRQDFTVMTRGGPAIESVWMNYPPPEKFHDTRFIGANFTDRQRIKRKAARWVKRLMSMPAAEREAILERIRLCSTTDQK